MNDSKDVQIEKLRTALKEAIDLAELYAPKVEHFCGPESGCDMLCVEAAYYAETVYPLRQVLKETDPAGPLILSRTVTSEPGAVIRAERLELSDRAKAGLTLPEGNRLERSSGPCVLESLDGSCPYCSPGDDR